ncbi:glycosyltransferase family 2 protein [Bifidobacterium reuteri]|uniref:glycosyltransferase family 2 protein n=1 Tax=Bifidobacterium reuteri TaxID=983706 RepID=UPI001CC30FBE|nr:glycosyltransferase family 2 protein [Bifidobacterium reuteri]
MSIFDVGRDMNVEQILNEKTNPLVTIIIPVHNVERFLDECVNSVVSQTYHNLQIVLVDDSSSDSSLLMCNDWATKDDRIRVFHLDEGRGASGARNIGLDHASGEYAMFVDSDDVLDSTAVEFCVSTAERMQCGMVIFGKSIIDESGKRICDYVIDDDVMIRSNSVDFYSGLSDLLRRDYLNTPWGKTVLPKSGRGCSF